MKTKEIETLKIMSQEAINSLPGILSIDGHGNLYIQGKRITPFELITRLTGSDKKAFELYHFIKRIKGRTIIDELALINNLTLQKRML